MFMSDADSDAYDRKRAAEKKTKEERDRKSYELGIIPNETLIIKIEPVTPIQSPVKVKIEPVTPIPSPIKVKIEAVSPPPTPIKILIEPVTPPQSPIKARPVMMSRPPVTKIPDIFYNRHHTSIKVAHSNAKRKYSEALMAINDVLDLEMERNNKYAKLWMYERSRREVAEMRLYDFIHKK